VQRLARKALEARGWRYGQDFLQGDDGVVQVVSRALQRELEQRRGQRRG
jgi:hypothetical protein